MDKQELFYKNKARIEQAWKLLEVAQELINNVVDEDNITLGQAHDIYETIGSASDNMYELYELNKKSNYNQKP